MDLAPHILRHPSESLFIRTGKYASTLWYRCLCKYNDMVVALRCGKFPCHKLVVGCHSRFFEEIFVNKKHTEVVLVDLDLPQFLYVTKPTLERVLRWMYTGEYQAPSEDYETRIVTNIVADFQLDGLAVLVGKRRSLTTGPTLATDEGAGKILSLKDLVGTDAFLDLDADSVIALLSDDHLCCLSEMDVFNAAWTWVYRDRAHRLRYIHKLMACVRFPLMTTRELLTCGAVLINYEECHDFIIVSGWYHTSMRYRDHGKMFFIVPKRRSGIGQGVSVPAPAFSLTGLNQALPLFQNNALSISKGNKRAALDRESGNLASREGSLDDAVAEEEDYKGRAGANINNNRDFVQIPTLSPLTSRTLRLDDILFLDDSGSGQDGGAVKVICRVCGTEFQVSGYRGNCAICGNEVYVMLGPDESGLYLFIKSHVMAEVERFRGEQGAALRRAVPLEDCIRMTNALLAATFAMMTTKKEQKRRPLSIEDIRYNMPTWQDVSSQMGMNDAVLPYARGSGQGADDIIQLIERVVPRLQECVDMLRRGIRGNDQMNRYGGERRPYNPDARDYKYRNTEFRSPDRGGINYPNAPPPIPNRSFREPPYPPQRFRYNQQQPPIPMRARLPNPGPPISIQPSNASPQTSSDLEKGGSDERKKVKKKKRSKPAPGIPEGGADAYEYEGSGGGGKGANPAQEKPKRSSAEKAEKEKSRARKKSTEARSQKKTAGKVKRSKGEKSLATKSVRSKRGKTKLMLDGQSIHPPPQRGAIPMPGIGGRARAPAAIRARSKVPE